MTATIRDTENCRVVSEGGRVVANYGANKMLKAQAHASDLNCEQRRKEIEKGYPYGRLTRYVATCD
tara:strand:+ start:514 stop:711 length:198 start_codon:yes stop_codon:yes gene_type:complete